MIAVQSTVLLEKIPISVSIFSVSQSIAQVLFLTLAQVIFIKNLKPPPSVHTSFDISDAVITTGAEDVRTVVSRDELPGILVAYSQGIDQFLFLATSISIGCFRMVWGMVSKDIRQRKAA